ncbi:divergent polysaccharide deacetylase family protein [Pararhodospirillum oryzae]|uniref:Divergent polysaccharide deacetylase family protein n=1 Tax=Pararhodospirillum oryzae TaxID=478448 RepID=A0A512H6F2_9PROT|nr:divergent polysaccharide deacetylase family protein [Pararhodospirillum oryzae]GEO81021.1 hypothetical protein ROR02_11520 [Pararhodospirillum oryzae]
MPAKKKRTQTKRSSPDTFNRRALLACAGALLLGVAGGAAGTRLVGRLAAATGPLGALPDDPPSFRPLTPGELARAQAESHRLISRQVAALEASEGAMPSIIDPPLDQAPRVFAPPAPAEPAALPPAPVASAAPPGGAPSPLPARPLSQASLPAQPRTRTPWRDNALALPDPGQGPKIAVVIDDLGLDRPGSQAMIALNGPLTLSCMAYAPDPRGLARAVHAGGHETMLHLPMEPRDASVDPGPGALKVGDSPAVIRARLAEALDRFPTVVGLNNHMGSRFTADRPGMSTLLQDVGQRGLMFLDSRTTGQSVAGDLAHAYHVPFAERAVFIDHENDPAVIRQQLALTEKIARMHGHAVAIGHPRPATHAQLAAWLPTLRGRGFALIPASAVIRLHA